MWENWSWRVSWPTCLRSPDPDTSLSWSSHDTWCPMCEYLIEIRNCMHRSIRVLNMWILMRLTVQSGWEPARGSHVILRHICGHFTGSYPWTQMARPTELTIVLTLVSPDNCPVATLIRLPGWAARYNQEKTDASDSASMPESSIRIIF